MVFRAALSLMICYSVSGQCPPVDAGPCPDTIPPFGCWDCGCPDPLPGSPQELLPGQAPLLFAQGHEGAILRDGQIANTDDIFLWVPANGGIPCCASNQVVLCETGQFFKIWDSGPTGGPNANDDDGNELRAIHFDAATASLMISYDDTTTTGFDAPFDTIADSALMRMTPTAIDATGLITAWTFEQLFDEGTVGSPGVLTDGDLWGLAVLDDATLLWGGGSVTLFNDQATTTTKASNDIARTEGISVMAPRHIGTPIFFSGNQNGGSVVGQIRGIHARAVDDVLISVSNQYLNNGTTPVLDRWDIGRVDVSSGLAEVEYAGELFFQTIDTSSAEMLGFHVLDSATDINALICLLGPTSPPALALRSFAEPPSFTPADTLLMTGVEFDGQPTALRVVDLNTCPFVFTFVPGDFDNNGNLYPADTLLAGPGRTLLVAQSTDDTIGQYDEFGTFLGQFISGDGVANIRSMARSGGSLYTSDWEHDDIHRFVLATGAPDGIDASGLFIPGELPPPDLDRPEGLAVLQNGELLVADIAQHTLLRYDAQTGQQLGAFVSNPLDDITANVRDIDVLANGDVVLTETSGDSIKRFNSSGMLIEQFDFDSPEGVHRLDDGNYLVTSGSTFGQGRGLFLVAPNGSILSTLDTSRSYGPLDLITFEETGDCPLNTSDECCDTNADGVLDEDCTWCECAVGACNTVAKILPADIGGAFGACPVDTFCNIHDRTHALTCFAGTNTCDTINIDAGGSFGACPLDGFCNIHDANHALTCFGGSNTCICGPAPEGPGEPTVVGTAWVHLKARDNSVRPGQAVVVDLFIESAGVELQSYQMTVAVSGGTRGHLRAADVYVDDARPDFVFSGMPEVFTARNVERGQLLGGLNTSGHMVSGQRYVGSVVLNSSEGARGKFVVDVSLSNDSQTALVSAFTSKIDIVGTTPAIMRFTQAKERARRSR
jgi:hypothetical protein